MKRTQKSNLGKRGRKGKKCKQREEKKKEMKTSHTLQNPENLLKTLLLFKLTWLAQVCKLVIIHRRAVKQQPSSSFSLSLALTPGCILHITCSPYVYLFGLSLPLIASFLTIPSTCVQYMAVFITVSLLMPRLMVPRGIKINQLSKYCS